MAVSFVVQLINIVILVGILGSIIGGGIFLQMYLSKRANRWIGIIPPALFLVFSLIIVFSMVAFTTTEQLHMEFSDDYRIIAVTTNHLVDYGTIRFGSVAFTFLYLNIPTLICIVIHAICRKNLKNTKALDRMNVQDL